jgi:ATP-dependent protease ClpP protease subunit
MPKEGQVFIQGPIGAFAVDNVPVQGMTLMQFTADVSALGEISVLRILMETPGGVKEVADQIYSYLMTLKAKGVKIITEQTGPIASAGVKVFGAGDERLALEGAGFMIHNPWTQTTGDAQALTEEAQKLKQSEEELKSFYSQLTGLAPEVIAPLMAEESYFDADTAVKLKFATEKKAASRIAAYNPSNHNMGKSLAVQLLDNLLNALKGGKTLSLVAELDGGAKLAILTQETDAAKMVGAQVVKADASGSPSQEAAADGEYTASLNGKKYKLTVAAGKISAMSPVEEPAPAPEEKKEEEEQKALTATMEAIATEFKTSQKALRDELSALLETKLAEVRAQIKSPGFSFNLNQDDKKSLAAKWDQMHQSNELLALKRDKPEEWTRMFLAKYGKMPQNV